MMKILFFIDRYFPTDHSFIEEVYTKILPNRGYDITLVARTKNYKSLSHTTWNDAKLILLPSRIKYFSDIINIQTIRKLMKEDFDIIQVRNDAVFSLLVPKRNFVYQLSYLKAEELMMAWKGKPFIYFKGLIDLALRNLFIRNTKLVFSVSDIMGSYLEKKYGVKNNATIPLGVGDVEINLSKVNSIREKYGLANKITFIYIGTFASPRRLNVVLDAFNKANLNNDMVFLLLGDAPDIKDVTDLKTRYGRSNSIHFIDRVARREVPDYIKASDIGLSLIPLTKVYHCSSPTKTIEYLNCGIPVIITNIPDQFNVVMQSRSGLVCDFNEHDIAAAMVKLSGSHNLKEMGASGKEYVREKRNYDIISNTIEMHYKNLYNSRNI